MVGERVEVERRLLVRVRLPERAHDVGLALDGIDGLEAKLGHALLATRLADRRIGPLAAEERPRSLGIPRAALVVADPAGARGEDGIADGVERVGRDEDHELPVHVCPAFDAGTPRP